MLVVALFYLAIPSQLLAPFVPAQGADSLFVKTGVAMLFFSSFWQIFDAAGITLGEALRAAGDTTFPMWSRAALAWGIFLPGSWVHVKFFAGTEKAAMGWLLLYLSLLGLVLYFRFRSGAWKKIELVEESLPI